MANRILIDTNNIQSTWYEYMVRLDAIDIVTRINTDQETL